MCGGIELREDSLKRLRPVPVDGESVGHAYLDSRAADQHRFQAGNHSPASRPLFAERFRGAERPHELAPGGGFDATRGLQAEASYGLPLAGGRFTGTPNVGFGMSDGGARDWRIGWRLTSAVPDDSGFELNLDALRRKAAGSSAPPDHGVMLRGAMRW